MSQVINALSIDVEDYFHASALDVPSSQWVIQEQRASTNTLQLLEILDETGVKATFFVLGWLAERFPSIVESIAGAGHEVACHGYSHKLIYRQSRAEFAEETYRAKAILEDITGQRVHGYRAASFSIVERSRWAIDVLADAGFSYDSSIFPVTHDRYGIRSAEVSPHWLAAENGKTILELPPSVLDLGPFRIPIAGGGYFRLYPYRFTRWAIQRINRSNRPVVVYLHPWEIDPGQPVPKLGFVTRFRHTVNIPKVKQRLRRLLADFSFEPMGMIAGRWLAAYAAPKSEVRTDGLGTWPGVTRSG